MNQEHAQVLDLITSPSTAKLDTALAKAQGEFTIAKKNATNPHFGKDYADITSIMNACRASLAKHLISVTQWPVASSDRAVTVLTRLAHDGEWMMAALKMPLGKTDAHGVGGAITYAKRFSLGAILGVVSEGEDDDGNSAVGDGKAKQGNQGQASQKPQGQAKGGGGKPSGQPQGKPSGNPAGKAEPKKPTFKEFLASFGWTEAQAQEWVQISYGLQSGDKSTPEMIEALKEVVQSQSPENAIFMARNP